MRFEEKMSVCSETDLIRKTISELGLSNKKRDEFTVGELDLVAKTATEMGDKMKYKIHVPVDDVLIYLKLYQ